MHAMATSMPLPGCLSCTDSVSSGYTAWKYSYQLFTPALVQEQQACRHISKYRSHIKVSALPGLHQHVQEGVEGVSSVIVASLLPKQSITGEAYLQMLDQYLCSSSRTV